jgi:hypothetical protein
MYTYCLQNKLEDYFTILNNILRKKVNKLSVLVLFGNIENNLYIVYGYMKNRIKAKLRSFEKSTQKSSCENLSQ